MNYKPEEDGITHINIYSKGKTKLGRFLTNFSNHSINHETLGYWASIESLWYGLSINFQNEEEKNNFRKLTGFRAKKQGRELRKKYGEIHVENFIEIIKDCINLKVISNEYYFNLFIKSNLPFTHYYIYGKDRVVDAGHKWLIEYFEEMRTFYRGEYDY